MRERSDLAVVVMRAITVALALVVAGLSLYVVAQRFHYPIDGEWMVGAVRDGVARVRDGKQLYVEPSDGFMPFIYAPLYFWVSGLVAHVFSVFVACKLVSIASTVALGWCIWDVGRIFGVSRFWRWIGVLLHVACYPLTIFFFDIERVDAIAAATVMLGVVALLRSERLAWTAAAGALLGLSFFAKQLNVVALVAAVAGLAIAGERKRAGVVLGAGAVAIAIVFAWVQMRSGGWFKYYCITLPGSHGIDAKLITTFFIIDVPKTFALAGGTVAILAPFAWTVLRTRRMPDGATWRDAVFASVLAACLAGAYFMRAHRGGWLNVIIFWTPMACAAVSIAASRLEERARGTALEHAVALVLAGGVALQFLTAMFDPNDAAPNADDYAEYLRLRGLVAELEKQGEVIVTTNGDISRPPHIHAAAFYDIIRAGKPAPAAFMDGLAHEKYAALLVGAPDEFNCDVDTCKDVVRQIQRYYFVAARREERDRNGMSGFDARARWIMRPRKHPLVGLDADTLQRRQFAEMGVAEMRRRLVLPNVESHPDDDIEDIAAALPIAHP